MKEIILPIGIIAGVVLAGVVVFHDGKSAPSLADVNYQPEELFKKGDCTVYRFLDNGDYHYYTDCVETLPELENDDTATLFEDGEPI